MVNLLRIPDRRRLGEGIASSQMTMSSSILTSMDRRLDADLVMGFRKMEPKRDLRLRFGSLNSEAADWMEVVDVFRISLSEKRGLVRAS